VNKTFQASVSISRTCSNKGDDYVTISVRESDKMDFLKIEMSLAAFAMAITGHSQVQVHGRFYGANAPAEGTVKP
jgi:hypothetical protein